MRVPFSICPIVTAAGAAFEGAVPVPFPCRVVACWVTDTDGVAADNTDYIDGDVTATTGYDSRAANQGALTADTPLALTVSAAGAILATGDQLKVTLAKGGSGKATEMGITWLVEVLPE